MVTGALSFMLILLAFVLVAFIYRIVTTPLAAVDAPTLVKAAAAPSARPPARLPRARAAPAATGAPRRLRSWSAALLAIGGLAAIMTGGWMFLHIAHGAAACSHLAIEVCSQGFVLLTGTQLAGGAIAVAGIGSVVIASILALR